MFNRNIKRGEHSPFKFTLGRDQGKTGCGSKTNRIEYQLARIVSTWAEWKTNRNCNQYMFIGSSLKLVFELNGLDAWLYKGYVASDMFVQLL